MCIVVLKKEKGREKILFKNEKRKKIIFYCLVSIGEKTNYYFSN